MSDGAEQPLLSSLTQEKLFNTSTKEHSINTCTAKHLEENTWDDVFMRWYVLGLFFFLTANQCLFWFTFSSDPTTVSSYYGFGDGTINQLLNWGPITFVPTVPFVAWILQRKDGVKVAMRSAAILSFCGCWIRLIPCVLSEETRKHEFVATMPLHIGQILNGIAGPVLIAAPSRLSAIWFPPRQRARVTAIANSSLFGAAIGFYLGPAINNMPKLLLITAVVSVVPLVLVLAYCPASPRHMPSASIQFEDEQGGRQYFVAMFNVLVHNPAMGLLMLTTGLGVGVYDAWIGVLPQVLTAVPSKGSAHRQPWNSNLNGAAGTAHTLACILGMWCAGFVADRCFRRRYKSLLIALYGISFIGFLWILCMLDTSTFRFASEVPRSTAQVFVAVSVVGFVRSATVPLLYELAAEITYPQPEGTSAALVVTAEHLTLLTLLFTASHVSLTALNLTCLGGLGLCPLVLVPLRARYLRMDAEDSSASTSTAAPPTPGSNRADDGTDALLINS